MRFSKYHQPKHHNGGRPLDPNSNAGQLRTKKASEARAKELEAFELFQKAESGTFNGFEFANIFHEKINKKDAIIIGESDDTATCHGVTVGADGVICYFFCEPQNAKKQIQFNRSVYIF